MLIQTQILPDFPGLTLSRRQTHLFIEPMNHIHRSFMFARASDSLTSFTVNVTFMPLYVPTEFFHINFGDPLLNGNREVWDIGGADASTVMESLKTAMRSAGMERLGKVQSPLDLARVLPNLYPYDAAGFAVREAVAYSLIYVEMFAEARTLMDELARVTLSFSDSTVPWHVELSRRTIQLQSLIHSDPQQAKQLLVDWEQHSIANLKLDGYAN